MVSIINVNVLFLSNSQLIVSMTPPMLGVNYQCQCPLFKQFTTLLIDQNHTIKVSIINVNVLFLSNSQRSWQCYGLFSGVNYQCQCPLFKQFTTLLRMYLRMRSGVNYQCQCPLFKQFTTPCLSALPSRWCQLSMSMSSF